MRSARQDLISTSRHLGELSSTFDLLGNDNTGGLPEAHRSPVRSILASCDRGPAKWAFSGKREVDELNRELETHLRTLGLAVEATTLALAHNIQDDTGAIRVDAARILDEIAKPRADLQLTATPDRAAGCIVSSTKGPTFILNRYLGSLTEYAKTAVDDAWVCNGGELSTIQGLPFSDEEDYIDRDDRAPYMYNMTSDSTSRAVFTTSIAKTANGETRLVVLCRMDSSSPFRTVLCTAKASRGTFWCVGDNRLRDPKPPGGLQARLQNRNRKSTRVF
ncbi:hypothetical protein B0T14DRAFT_567994 [Immersiella caudata]|uniref:Uncharacterized protein n=1 Tax=Immersiella caudata TaxID=314043 RepID=A0AA40BWJ6_9PEZI|nr:hypothetical protein B0T14DRAFT_567994 [Immersiella caudata]